MLWALLIMAAIVTILISRFLMWQQKESMRLGIVRQLLSEAVPQDAKLDQKYIRWWIDKLFTDDELLAELLRDVKSLEFKNGAIQVTDLPQVEIRNEVGYVTIGDRTQEMSIDGYELRVLEYGPRGGITRTNLNWAALLRVLVGLDKVQERKHS